MEDATEVEPAADVTDADITAALVLLRALNGGHEPYAPAVYPCARVLAQRRVDAEHIALAKAEEVLRYAGAQDVVLLDNDDGVVATGAGYIMKHKHNSLSGLVTYLSDNVHRGQ